MVKDALTDCDTEQCAQGFHSIIRSENSENEFYLRKWFMKLVFHKNPTKNMINLVHVSRGVTCQSVHCNPYNYWLIGVVIRTIKKDKPLVITSMVPRFHLRSENKLKYSLPDFYLVLSVIF